jgi:hypothetical protein
MSIALPKKVLEAEAKAEELYKQVYEAKPEDAPNEEPAPEQPSAETTEPPAQEETPEPVGSQGIEPPPQQEEDLGEEETWEHRFKVLTGKYSAEVPRLAADNRELKNQLKVMEAELEAMKQGKAASPQSFVKPEEVEEYGEPLIDLIRRAAREEVSAKESEIKELKAKIDAFDSRTSKVVEVDFYESLAREVPDWVAINDDKNFHKWLSGYDELTGEVRQNLLSQAEASRDARLVANFFKAYKKAGQSWAASASKKLESQVVPDSSRVSKPPVGKKIWTSQEIGNFYAAMRRGDVSDKDAVAIEADIHAAQLEGRIR